MKIDPNIALSETGFLFHASSGDSYSVNPVGLRIIELVREGKTEPEIIDGLVAEFEVSAQQAEEDLQDYLLFLRQLKILTHG